jgi:hypothetical protein
VRYTPTKVFTRILARQNKIARLFQRQLGFWRRHMSFSHRCSVLRPLYRTLHDLLRYRRSLALLRPVCLQPVCLSSVCPSLFCPSDWLANPIAWASFTRLILPLFVDSLDSELYYRSGYRTAALASSSTSAVGTVFPAAFHYAERAPRVTSSLTAKSPTIRSL